jgi:hypothetical protein
MQNKYFLYGLLILFFIVLVLGLRSEGFGMSPGVLDQLNSTRAGMVYEYVPI